MDCYEILEVSQNASPEVIKAAYKSLMQRYHPDKNPDNAQIAAHALQVVQAYEVLSDSDRRAAYDIKLKQRLIDNLQVSRDRGADDQDSSVANNLHVAKEKRSYWFLWLLIALIIVFCLYAMSLFKNKKTEEILGTYLGVTRQEASAAMKEVLPRTIPVYISNLTVDLKVADGFSGDTARVLTIPTLGVRVGEFDANKVLRFIDNNKELIRQKLEEKLVDARYEELIKVDGEQYLKDIVKDSIGDTTGTNQYKADPMNNVEAAGQYGVVDILLPRSFSVH
jgi:curved DNA-binding protein CbpA